MDVTVDVSDCLLPYHPGWTVGRCNCGPGSVTVDGAAAPQPARSPHNRLRVALQPRMRSVLLWSIPGPPPPGRKTRSGLPRASGYNHKILHWAEILAPKGGQGLADHRSLRAVRASTCPPEGVLHSMRHRSICRQSRRITGQLGCIGPTKCYGEKIPGSQPCCISDGVPTRSCFSAAARPA